MAYNVHITFFWGWAKKLACLPAFQQWANQPLAATFLAKITSEIRSTGLMEMAFSFPLYHMLVLAFTRWSPDLFVPEDLPRLSLVMWCLEFHPKNYQKSVLVAYEVVSGPQPQKSMLPREGIMQEQVCPQNLRVSGTCSQRRAADWCRALEKEALCMDGRLAF